MPSVEATPPPLIQPGFIKMEDRKRSNPYDQPDVAPPLKRQATVVNGAGKSHGDSDPFKDDLEVC